MKKILLATTAVVLTAGASFAEVTIDGSAVFGLNYDDAAAVGTDKTTTLMETYLNFGAVVESDAGLTFGYNTTIATYSTAGGLNDDGTSVYMKGAFGKLTFGSVGEADEMAGGLSDIGLTGIGIDNVAEVRTGDSGSGLAHNVNYSHEVGALSFAVSTALGKSTAAVALVAATPGNAGTAAAAAAPNDSMAVGVKYTFGDYYVGLGYNDTNAATGIVTPRDGKNTSVYAGGKMGAFGVKAMYSKFSSETAAAADDVKAYGINMDYTTGAATISFAYADNDLAANTKASYGLGVSYDLGAGAAVVGGIGSVNGSTKAQMGVSFSF